MLPEVFIYEVYKVAFGEMDTTALNGRFVVEFEISMFEACYPEHDV